MLFYSHIYLFFFLVEIVVESSQNVIWRGQRSFIFRAAKAHFLIKTKKQTFGLLPGLWEKVSFYKASRPDCSICCSVHLSFRSGLNSVFIDFSVLTFKTAVRCSKMPENDRSRQIPRVHYLLQICDHLGQWRKEPVWMVDGSPGTSPLLRPCNSICESPGTISTFKNGTLGLVGGEFKPQTGC